MPTRFTLQVPATSANLGAGFDCLGLALDFHNLLAIEPADQLTVSLEGEGDEVLARDASNRVVRAMSRACARLKAPLPYVRLHMTNRIPLARGLGSSAAAAVGGLLAANHYYDDPLSRDELMQLATEIEGHPDNVAPALLGGLCVVSMDGAVPVAVRLEMPAELRCVVFVPDQPLATKRARAALPKTVSHGDAAFNLSRAALWVAAVTQRRFYLLRLATQDRLH
ncbi:MAG: homoserine kinase, partial [Chloroflexi bacterium]|nr:homoserine kinase [Chloroflexota bacterium]